MNKEYLDLNYCLISTTPSNSIQFTYIEREDKHLHYIVFSANLADEIFSLINLHNYVSSQISFSHALYIGRELHKAEIAIFLRQKYIQN